jgi:hypothetical protein
MEFFVPGLLFFILTVIFTFYIAPKATPMMAAILSLLFLTYGVYDHYRLFASEYRLSTWQEPLLQYSPAVMIAVIILYVLYGMIALFTKGQVPVPAMPAIPSVEEAVNHVADSLSYAANSIAQTANNITNNIANNVNYPNNTHAINNNNKNNKSNLSRSFVESV